VAATSKCHGRPRGITNPDLFPHLEALRGFRSSGAGDQDLSSLARRHFDIVSDVWPNDPAIVASAAKFPKDRAPHYPHGSSVAAYDAKEFTRPISRRVLLWKPGTVQDRKYNRGKAESERRLRAILGDRLTIVRPGPIKGDRDDTPDLLTWLIRAQNGGRHIAPGRRERPRGNRGCEGCSPILSACD